MTIPLLKNVARTFDMGCGLTLREEGSNGGLDLVNLGGLVFLSSRDSGGLGREKSICFQLLEALGQLMQ